MTIQRVEHVVVVVDDFEAAISFFVEVGMEMDRGTTPVEGDWVAVGLDAVRVEIAVVRSPDGHGGHQLTKFHDPTASTAEPNAPANTFGLRPIMFRCRRHRRRHSPHTGSWRALVGEMAPYEDRDQLCYFRGAAVIIALAEQVRQSQRHFAGRSRPDGSGDGPRR